MLAFIDESGDEGTGGRGSRWLVFGCAMVSQQEAVPTKNTARTAAALATTGRQRWLHFVDMSHDDKHGAIDVLCLGRWHGVIVATDTSALLPGSRLKDPGSQYRYAARYVIERISAYASELREPATIFFEHRRSFDFGALLRYIDLLRTAGGRIESQWIDPARISQLGKGTDETLCIADALAYAGFRALEPHRLWKRYERSYLDALMPRLWRGPTGRENLHTWGLVLMPTSLWGSKFVREYPWLRALR